MAVERVFHPAWQGLYHRRCDALESKSDKTDVTYADMVGNVATHAYLPMDPEKGFEIKCVATVEKFEGKKLFGLIMDYIDDMNCLIFMIHTILHTSTK